MKPAHPILKIVTLSVFAVLISGFVAYRAGALNGIFYGDRTASNVGDPPLDSPGVDSVKYTFTPDVMMSSSKSTIAIEPNNQYVTDTGKNKNKSKPQSNTNTNNANPPANANQSAPVYMGGSKSAAVFVPEPDTVKLAPPQQQQQQKPKK